MELDYIIVGQGICGTFLSWNLMKAGKKVLVIDDDQPFSSTKVASGVINPVTGRRIVRTWEIDKLLPFAKEAYTALGNELSVSLVRQCNILDFHPTPQMELAFRDRLVEEKEYLRIPTDQDQWKYYFNYPFSIGEIDPCLLLDLHSLLREWRKKLALENALLSTRFEWVDCSIENEQVIYKDQHASKIIFCEGSEGIDNRYFNLLPYARNKGEAIIASIPGLPRDNIYKQGINLVPWQDDLWWIGSTYDWNFTDLLPTADFRRKVQTQLYHWLKLPFEIVDHIASERPANMERRPFAGLHPVHQTVGLFNGMGTKGCSLSPYFAKQFTDYLLYQTPMEPLVDVNRFKKILSR
ncbi:MAG: FAD-binding oxidoreductase [Chitinophagaceae bacterium]|nr:FAD-binding oxidoreductase [Chitinophagaceae bacterium]